MLGFEFFVGVVVVSLVILAIVFGIKAIVSGAKGHR
jgi:hypothetical protein